MARKDLALELFRSFQNGRKTQRKNSRATNSNPNSTTKDPELLGNILSQLIEDRDWRAGIAEGNLFSLWANIVGEEISSHALPVSLLDGSLTVQTTSTAWAVQLRMMEADLLKTIQASAPGALVDAIIIIGPQTPSWKRGLRTIRGAKGPRDTYG